MNIRTILSELVACNSVYPNESKVTEVLTRILKDVGFSVSLQEVQPGRANILASRGDNPKILFYGHQDTVPLVNKDEWETDPFTLTPKDDSLFGLGAYDMKGGMVAFLSALRATNTAAKVFLAIDEENISRGAWYALNESPEFFEGLEIVISAEPNFGLGLHGITTARTGRVIYHVEAKGIPEHISLYKSAEDAIEKLSAFITNVYRTRETAYKDTKTVVQVRKISGESVGMSVCAGAIAEVEVLLGADDTIETVQETLKSLGQVDVMLKERETPYLPGYRFTKFPYMHEIATIVKKHTKEDVTYHERSSVGDDNALATLGIPVLTWGPDGGNAHKPNEWVSLHSLESLSKMYRELLEIVS